MARKLETNDGRDGEGANCAGESALDRALRLLTLFSAEKTQWTVEEAGEALGSSPAQTYRYVRSLSAAGLVSSFTPGLYALGPAIIELDRKMRHSDPMIVAARPIMARMIAQVPHGLTSILCRYYREQVICVHEEFVSRPDATMSYERGLPMPIYKGAASKVILAALPLRTIRVIATRHAREFAEFGLGGDWTEVKQTLRRLRSQHVVTTSGELGPSSSGVSAPVLDGQRVLGSVSLVIPNENAFRSAIEAAIPIVRNAAAELTLAMTSMAVRSGALAAASPLHGSRN